MGGSGGGYGGSSGGWSSGSEPCSGPFYFSVLITGNAQSIYSSCAVSQGVYINVIKGAVPVLQVLRISDDFYIGVVPPSQSGVIISCINNGWRYSGRINKVSGTQNNPDIQIVLMGEK
ncbi:MAG: hypothetical protein NC238_15945 [Dehalobacter sp.]|nr:hypothetical protein [Dehalobacter sp.]